MQTSTPPKVAAFFNESAGTVVGQSGQSLRDTLVRAFEQHGLAGAPEFLPGPELKAAAERALEKAKRGELDAVLVGGGDGSIRTVAGVLAGSDVPLGVIPLGTLNHFAKDLGIPLDIDAAVAAIAAGVTHPVDVGEVNGQTFINNSSIGMYPYMVLDRERRRALAGHRKWVAMILASVRTLRNFPLRRLSIRAEGWTEPCRSPCVFVGNNEYGLTGPTLGKRERLDRGELCLYVTKHQSRLSLLWLAFRSVLGLLNQERDLRTLKISAAEIDAHTSRLPVAFDGEVDMIRPPLRYRIRPGALQVFVPATAA